VVLCVDDDEGVITLFRRYLDKQGYRVVGLTDPFRVVEEAPANPTLRHYPGCDDARQGRLAGHPRN
jgi:Response regulator receiver domain.